jgi:hypothetical protein
MSAQYHAFTLRGVRMASDLDNSLLREDLSEPDDAVGVRTGIHTGFLRVALAVLDAPPAAIADGWQTVVEVALDPTGEDFAVTDWGDGPIPALPEVPTAVGRRLRLRAHARHRDVAYDGGTGDPQEEYLLLLWPDDSAEGRVLRDSGTTSAELHGSSRAPRWDAPIASVVTTPVPAVRPSWPQGPVVAEVVLRPDPTEQR